MLTKKFILLWVLILFFFVSCINTTTKNESASISTSTATLRISPTTIATEASSPTLSPTPFPTVITIPPKDAYPILLGMLNENVTCELPCWLDITPGASIHAEAYQKWASFLTLLDTGKPGMFSYYFEYDQNDEDFSMSTRYFLQPNNDTIDSMYITTQTLGPIENGIRDYVYDSIVYKKIFNNYLLSSVLKKYGQPGQILLSMDITYLEEPSPDSFNIWLFYPARGAIINYEGEAIIQNNIIKGCPSNTFITLWLAAPGSNNLHSETLDEEIWSSSSKYYKSTEEAIGMTTEEFFAEFSNPNSSCIESPLDIWLNQ